MSLRPGGKVVPKGEEGLLDDPYDLMSHVNPEVQLLRDTLPADSAQTTYARMTLLGNRDLQGVPRSPLSCYIIIDHSSSVDPDLLDMAKMTALIMMEGLQTGDECTVVACGSEPRLIAPCFVKGEAPISRVEREILALRPGGGCDLIGSVVMAGWRAKESYQESRTSRIFVLGAGWADADHGLTQVVRDLAKDCVYTHVYAFGPECNSELLIGLVNAGGGQYHRIRSTDQINDVVATEITRNAIAGKHVRLCIRPRHKSVDVLELYDFEYVKEDDTLIVDVGDIYYKGNVDILVKLAYKCPPGRKDILEVHVSHHDTNDDRHLRTFLLTGVFVIDPSEVQAALPYSLVVDKVMKVNTALALVLAEQAVRDSDLTSALEILNSQIQRLSKAQSLGGNIVQTLQENLKNYVVAYDETGANFKVLRVKVLEHARLLYRSL